MLKDKPRIAILSLHPHNHGGILSSLKVVYDFCKIHFEPTVFFLGFDPHIATSLKEFKIKSKTRYTEYFGMPSVEIGARWGQWEPGHYQYTLDAWKDELKDYDYFFVTSGTALAAHPLALMDKKFILWVASSHADDRKDRVRDLSYWHRMWQWIGHEEMLKIEQEILKASSYTLLLSGYTEALVQKVLGVSTVPNASRCPFPVKANESLASWVHQKTVMAVGRFADPRKNLTMLLRVYKNLIDDDANVSCLVVGEVDLNDPLVKECVDQYPQIVFMGHVSAETLKMLYAQATLMLITSYQEGLGIVGLEAMAAGVPIVATACGGVEDYVHDDITGFLVKQDDICAMVQRAQEILYTQSLHVKLQLQGQQLIKSCFSQREVYHIFTQALVSVYPELNKVFQLSERIQDSESAGSGTHLHFSK